MTVLFKYCKMVVVISMKIAFLYNPNSGSRPTDWIKAVRRDCREHELYEFNLLERDDFCNDAYDLMLVSGGDGTVNRVVTRLIEGNNETPIGIIPAGTANDYATHLKVPNDFNKCIPALLNGTQRKIDVGLVNGRIFINICGLGNFMESNIGHSRESKKMWGKLAYYWQGLEKFFKVRPCKLKITTDGKRRKGKFYTVMVMCGTSAGGFSEMAKGAKSDDGLLDFIGIRAVPIIELPLLFLKMIFGKHLKDKRILHLQASEIKIEKRSKRNKNKLFKVSNIDGETGPEPPLKISVLPKKITVIDCGFLG